MALEIEHKSLQERTKIPKPFKISCNQMALNPILISNLNIQTHFSISPTIISFFTPTSVNKTTDYRTKISRRLGLIALMASSEPAKMANGLDLNLIAADQTFDEAARGIRGHAESLLEVKEFIESESWKEAQKIVRRTSPLLKQDIRTIILYKPAAERPALRKLYSQLFNNATRLDYAARDKDREQVMQCYDNMVKALSHILSRV